MRKTVAVMVAVMGLGAGVSTQVITQRPGVPPGVENRLSTARPDAPLPDYRVGIDDVLLVNVWGEEKVSGPVKVRPDGKITLPLGNDIFALDLSPDELKARIVGELKRFYENPVVSLQVQEMNSRLVFITGAVNKPGPYPLLAGMTVVQLITTAGGLLEFADSKNIMLISKTLKDERTGQPLSYRINYDDISRGRNVGRYNIELRPGDQVIVR